MTNKEAIEYLRELKTIRIEFLNPLQEQALDMAIKALDIYKTFCPVEFPTEDDPYPVCSYIRPTGEWIPQSDFDGFTYWKCSECNKESDFIKFNYCPNCGAKMKGGAE